MRTRSCGRLCGVVMLVALLAAPAARGDQSVVEHRTYSAASLGRAGAFLIYLPPGYHRAQRSSLRYPVLYLLHGSDSRAGSFLRLGLQDTLDRMTRAGAMPATIVVMLQGGLGENGWLNRPGSRYEDYVIETQELVDRYYRTLAVRQFRAIAGYSMGGFGAVHVALDHLDRFSVAESWSGYFGGLAPLAEADRGAFAALPLRAFLYGGARDHIVDPRQNVPFAARLRADGVSALGSVYPGAHDQQLWSSHLGKMLRFAGRAFRGQR